VVEDDRLDHKAEQLEDAHLSHCVPLPARETDSIRAPSTLE
jgi:hypothetical protein